MRCCVLTLLATAQALQTCGGARPFAARVGDSLRALVTMQLDAASGAADPTQHFRGSLYGVTATVALHMRTRRAEVELRGVPIGGALSGVGWLKDLDGDAGEVELDEAFAAKLAWRLVRIRSAALDRAADTVTVTIGLPVFGDQALTLARVHPTESCKT